MASLDDTKAIVLQFFHRHPAEQLKPRELARRLSLKDREDYRHLMQALNELLQSGAIARTKRRR